MKPETSKKLVGIAAIAILLLFSGLTAYYIGRPMLAFASQPDKFRLWVESHGIFGALTFIGMMVLQILVAVIPGEPLELGAGYAFGFFTGSLLCLISIALGSALVFLLVRRFGIHLVECFFAPEKIKSLKILHQSPRRDLLLFLVLFVPGTPKDLLSYFAGLTDLPLWKWVLIATVARIPSVLTSTAGGSFVGDKNYLFAILVFAATMIISIIGAILYKRFLIPKKEM